MRRNKLGRVGNKRQIQYTDAWLVQHSQTYLGKWNIQVNTNKDILTTQIDLVGEAFDIELGLGRSGRMEGTLPSWGAELLRGHTSSTEEERTKHVPDLSDVTLFVVKWSSCRRIDRRRVPEVAGVPRFGRREASNQKKRGGKLSSFAVTARKRLTCRDRN